MANSVDLIRMLLEEQSNLGLNCLPRPVWPKSWDHYGSKVLCVLTLNAFCAPDMKSFFLMSVWYMYSYVAALVQSYLALWSLPIPFKQVHVVTGATFRNFHHKFSPHMAIFNTVTQSWCSSSDLCYFARTSIPNPRHMKGFEEKQYSMKVKLGHLFGHNYWLWQ